MHRQAHTPSGACSGVSHKAGCIMNTAWSFYGDQAADAQQCRINASSQSINQSFGKASFWSWHLQNSFSPPFKLEYPQKSLFPNQLKIKHFLRLAASPSPDFGSNLWTLSTRILDFSPDTEASLQVCYQHKRVGFEAVCRQLLETINAYLKYFPERAHASLSQHSDILWVSNFSGLAQKTLRVCVFFSQKTYMCSLMSLKRKGMWLFPVLNLNSFFCLTKELETQIANRFFHESFNTPAATPCALPPQGPWIGKHFAWKVQSLSSVDVTDANRHNFWTQLKRLQKENTKETPCACGRHLNSKPLHCWMVYIDGEPPENWSHFIISPPNKQASLPADLR